MPDPAYTESPWYFALFGVLIVVGVAVVYVITIRNLAQARYMRLFAKRTHATAFDTCRAALPDVDSTRLRNAYRWVQQLVPYPNPPIQASTYSQKLPCGRIRRRHTCRAPFTPYARWPT